MGPALVRPALVRKMMSSTERPVSLSPFSTRRTVSVRKTVKPPGRITGAVDVANTTFLPERASETVGHPLTSRWLRAADAGPTLAPTHAVARAMSAVRDFSGDPPSSEQREVG